MTRRDCWRGVACQPAQREALTPINKQPISQVMSDRLYDYLLAHTREPEVLRRLREETATMSAARMQISPEQGAFMALLAQLLSAKRYLEVRGGPGGPHRTRLAKPHAHLL